MVLASVFEVSASSIVVASSDILFILTQPFPEAQAINMLCVDTIADCESAMKLLSPAFLCHKYDTLKVPRFVQTE